MSAVMSDAQTNWPMVPLSGLLRRAPRYGINAAAVELSMGDYGYIRITDIDEDGLFAPHPKVSVRHPSAGNHVLAIGELVFARTGASVGKSYLYDPHDGELVYAGFLINIAPDTHLLNPKYLSLVVQTQSYWDWVARTSVRSGQPGINGREYAQMLIPLPDIQTQSVIAQAATDTDESIVTLKRLIAKKQAIKQGMMQQLLTGETRLSGFSAPWRDGVSLLNLCEKRSGYWGSDIVTPAADIAARVIRAGDISGDGHLVGAAVRYLSSSEWNKASCHVDDVVVTVSGNGLGKTFYVRTPSELAASNFVRILRPRVSVSGEYLAYVMQSSKARQKLKVHTATSAYPNLLPSFFAEPWLIVPSYDEQIAIATVLRSSDAQIYALHIRLAKVKNIKQGMMQELLTGRTRLAGEKGRA